MSTTLFARLGALFFAIWGVFHVYVAWQICTLALTQNGIAQVRTLQLAAYMLTIALFAVVIALWRNWRNDRLGYWLNLWVVSWADIIWVLVVVLPGYVPLARGLIAPAFWLAGHHAGATSSRRSGVTPQAGLAGGMVGAAALQRKRPPGRRAG
jgi:hypothetical protein